MSEYRTAYDARSRRYGGQNIIMAQSHDHFGDIYLLQNGITEAVSEYKLSMEIRSKNLGNEHPLIAVSLENFGHVLAAERKHEEAISQYEKAKLILKNTFGEKHPAIARVLSHISKALICQGREREALALLDESLHILTETMGDNDPSVLATYEMIGTIHHDLKEYHEALNCYTKTLEIRKRTLGEQHIDYATSLENVGRTNFELHSFNQVVDYFERASRIRKFSRTCMSLADGHQSAKIATFVKEKKSLEAFIQLSKTVALRYGEKHSFGSWDSWLACLWVDKTYEQLNQHKEAVEFWEAMKQQYEKNLGWTHSICFRACVHISYHNAKAGVTKEPTEYTRVQNFIAENITNLKLSDEWDRDKIAAALFQIVALSINDEGKAEQSSYSISILNFMGISLQGKDFSGIKIPYADLSQSNLDGANFTGADLKYASLSNAQIGNCSFEDCQMEMINLGLPRETLSIPKSWIMDLQVMEMSDGYKLLVSGSSDHVIRFWDVATGNIVKVLEGHSATISCVHMLQGPNDEKWLASCGDDTTIRIWDVLSGDVIRVLESDSFSPVYSVIGIKGPNGERWLASGSKDNTITIWDLATGDRIKVLIGHSHYVLTMCYVNIRPGVDCLISGGGDKRILVWDIESGTVTKTFEGHANTVNAICPVKGPKDENWLASASDDKSVRIWDINSSSLVMVMEGHTDFARCVCGIEGPQGERWIASGGNDNVVRIWDLVTGNELVTFHGHQRAVITLCVMENYNHCEMWLASGSFDGFIRFWSLKPDDWTLPEQNIGVNNHERARELSSVKASLSSETTRAESCRQQATQSKSLQGGDISLRNARGLNTFNKRVLLSHGGVSFDEDFVQHCLASNYTPFQAIMMGHCYENGLGIHMDADKAVLWTTVLALKAASDYASLTNMCEKGSVAAFEALVGLAKEDSGGTCKRPLAAKSVAGCFERGWAVEKDIKTAVEWYDRADDFAELKRLAVDGSAEGLEKLKHAAMKKTATGPKHPMAGKLLGECYENGWLGEASLSSAIDWYGRAKCFPELKRLAQQGSTYAFGTIKDISEAKMGHQLRYPEAAAIVAECVQNGWGC